MTKPDNYELKKSYIIPAVMMMFDLENAKAAERVLHDFTEGDSYKTLREKPMENPGRSILGRENLT